MFRPHRRLNVRVLLWLLGTSLLLGTCVHFLHGFQIRRNAGVFLDHAELALKENKLDQAATYFSHYLVFEPNDLKAKAQYALVLDRLARTPATRLRTVLVMNDVLRQDPGQKEVRYRLVHQLVALNRIPEAAKELEQLRGSWPDQAEIEHMVGWCQDARGDFPNAVASFEKAVALAPHRLPTYTLWAEVLEQRLGQPEEAIQVMDRMVAANPDALQAYLIRSRFHKQAGRLAEAEKDIQKALAMAPKQADVLLAAADLAQARNDLAQAREFLDQGLALHPKNIPLHRNRAVLEMRAGHPREAIASLRRGLKAVPDARDLQVLLADLLLDQGAVEEVRKMIEHLRTTGSPALPDYLQARLDIRDHRWGQALSLLEKSRKELGESSDWGSQIHSLLGLCYEHVGDLDQQLASFQKAVALDPSWSAARLGLGTALLASGRITDSLAELDQVRSAPDAPPGIWIAVARALLQRNLRLPELQRDWNELNRVLDRAGKETPQDPQVALLRAEALLARKQTEPARSALEQAVAKNPQGVELWSALANLENRTGRPKEALVVLDKAQEKLGDRVELRQARARLLAQVGGPEARTALSQLGENLDAYTPEDQARLLRELAEAWYRLGDRAAAEKILQQATILQPRDLRSRFSLFELALQAGREERARELAQELAKLEGPGGALARFARASLLVRQARQGDRKAREEADKLLKILARQQRGSTQVSLLQAQIAELEGQFDLALEYYLQALEQGERQPRTVFRLIQLLHERSRDVEADRALRTLEEDGPLGKDLSKIGAEVALSLREKPRALQFARAAVSEDSRDYRDFLWLGEILHRAGQEKQAEAAFKQAVHLADYSPDPWLALVRQQVRSGNSSGAEATLEQMQAAVVPDQADLAVARGLDLLGKVEPAATKFREVAAKSPGDFFALSQAADFFLRQDQPKQAEIYLRNVLKPELGAPAQITGPAGRHLALVLAGQGTPAAFREGQALLSRSGSVADLRALAAVLGTQPNRRGEALELFEKNRSRQPLSPDEQFQLALLQEATGNRSRSRELFQDLLATHPDHRQYLAGYIRVLLSRGEFEEAQRYLHRLAVLEPGSQRVTGLRDDLEKAKQRAAEGK